MTTPGDAEPSIPSAAPATPRLPPLPEATFEPHPDGGVIMRLLPIMVDERAAAASALQAARVVFEAAPGDPAAARVLAERLEAAGQVAMMALDSNAAIDAWQEALALRRAAAARAPGDRPAAQAVCQALHALVAGWDDQGRQEEARAGLAELLSLRRALVEREPEVAWLQLELAHAQIRAGHFEHECEHRCSAEALAHLEAALSLLDEVERRWGVSEVLLHQRARALCAAAGNELGQGGCAEEASRRALAALEVLGPLGELRPGGPERVRSVLSELTSIGARLGQLPGQREAARRILQAEALLVPGKVE